MILSLAARGLVEQYDAPPAPADFQPLQMAAPGLSETILAERREVATYFLDSSAIAKLVVDDPTVHP